MIKRLVLIGLACLPVMLISSCGDNRTTTGYNRGDSAGDGEPESSTSSDQSNSSTSSASVSSSATSVSSSSGTGGYVDKYPDLSAAYNANTGGLSKSEWAKNHYCAFGQIEGRSYSGLSTASCSTASTSTSSSTSSNSSSDFEGYVDKYPDLLAAYNDNRRQSKSAWGEAHYNSFGKGEGRTLSEGAGSTTSTATTSSLSGTKVTDVRSSLGLPSLAPTGTVWKPISEGDHKLVILTPASWSALPATIRNTDGSLIDTGTSCRRTNGNRCTYRFSRAGGGYPNPCVLRLGGTDYLINNPAQRIN